MTKAEFSELKPALYSAVYDAVFAAVTSMDFAELKKIDWMTTSADENIEADTLKAA